ncbi:MAG: serine hydrolase [Terriglobia bacterium]
MRESIPLIQFYNNPLNDNVTLRDMLSHRTGVTRHDSIWFRSSFTRKELFERVKSMEPQQPLGQMLLYNNLMCPLSDTSSGITVRENLGRFREERIFSPVGHEHVNLYGF